MDVVKTLEDKLIKDRKILGEFQTKHITTTITFLKDMKKDFKSARADYEKSMRELDR